MNAVPFRTELLPKNSSLVITQYILGILRKGKIYDIDDLGAVYREHHALCVKNVVQWLEQTREGNKTQYEEIVKLLEIAFKYNCLYQWRQQLNKKLSKDINLDELTQVKKKDLQPKHF